MYKVYCPDCGHEMELLEYEEIIDGQSFSMVEYYCEHCEGFTPNHTTKKRWSEYE